MACFQRSVAKEWRKMWQLARLAVAYARRSSTARVLLLNVRRADAAGRPGYVRECLQIVGTVIPYPVARLETAKQPGYRSLPTSDPRWLAWQQSGKRRLNEVWTNEMFRRRLAQTA